MIAHLYVKMSTAIRHTILVIIVSFWRILTHLVILYVYCQKPLVSDGFRELLSMYFTQKFVEFTNYFPLNDGYTQNSFLFLSFQPFTSVSGPEDEVVTFQITHYGPLIMYSSAHTMGTFDWYLSSKQGSRKIQNGNTELVSTELWRLKSRR